MNGVGHQGKVALLRLPFLIECGQLCPIRLQDSWIISFLLILELINILLFLNGISHRATFRCL